jgi:hypothetical protein
MNSDTHHGLGHRHEHGNGHRHWHGNGQEIHMDMDLDARLGHTVHVYTAL